MTGNAALDVVIGLIFIYTLYSLLTTTVVEIVSINLQFKARNLSKAISRMLNDDDKEIFAKKFFKQPLIKFMSSGWLRLFNKPSFIQPQNFSRALVELLKEGSEGKDQIEKVKTTLNNYKDTETGKLLLSFIEEAGDELDKFRLLIEQWFDDMMDRATSWYKKYMVYATFIAGLIIAIIFNVDTFQIASYLSKDKQAREEFIQLAGNLINNESFISPAFDTALRSNLLHDTILRKKYADDSNALDDFVNDSVYAKVNEAKTILMQRMDTLYSVSQQSQNILSFKRNEKNRFLFDDWYNFWGCIVTALALSLGAPFWFELLKKMMQLRGALSKPIAQTKNTADTGNNLTPLKR